MPSRVFTILSILITFMMPGTLNSQQGAGPPQRKSSVDQLNADDFAPSDKPAETKPRRKPARPRPSVQAPVAGSTSPPGAWREPVTGMEMVWVPEGCYEMGCGSWTSDCRRNENPAHEVCVDGFWIGKHEVTQGQWRRVMGTNPSHFKKGDGFPVEQVSWNDAQEFVRKLKSMNGGKYEFRLPTEAEWEYACRSGGKPEKHSGGEDIDQVAWYSRNSGSSTQKAGTKAPNGLGIHDMSGNVWEWVEDIYDGAAYHKHPRNNPVTTGGGSYRVERGVSWFMEGSHARCGYRRGSDPADRGDDLGFRVARTP